MNYFMMRDYPTVGGGFQKEKTYLTALLENISDGILIMDSDGYIKRINRKIEIIFGYSAEELIGKNFAFWYQICKRNI